MNEREPSFKDVLKMSGAALAFAVAAGLFGGATKVAYVDSFKKASTEEKISFVLDGSAKPICKDEARGQFYTPESAITREGISAQIRKGCVITLNN